MPQETFNLAVDLWQWIVGKRCGTVSNQASIHWARLLSPYFLVISGSSIHFYNRQTGKIYCNYCTLKIYQSRLLSMSSRHFSLDVWKYSMSLVKFDRVYQGLFLLWQILPDIFSKQLQPQLDTSHTHASIFPKIHLARYPALSWQNSYISIIGY